MNTAIIVAAGTGSRFGGDTPKQFLDLNGKPVIHHTISVFESCVIIDEIILVVAEDRLSTCLPYLETFGKLKAVIAGGESRAESVRNGLERAKADGIIAVHDGARPLITADEIEKTVKAAQMSGAACLVVTVSDTIKSIDEGVIVSTVDREQLRRAVTPQCFRYDILKQAFASDEFSGATDESSLVEKLGIKVTAVEGSARNIKITTADDLKVAEALMC